MRYRVEVNTQRCKGCGLCVSVCPKEVLRMAAALNRRGLHYAEVEQTDKCIGCRQCGEICPDCAISIERENDAGATRKKRP